MNKGSSSNGVIIGILIVLVVVIVGWFAYNQGWFAGRQQDKGGVEVNIGGSSDSQ
jgi:hypothetical protein